MKPIHRNTEEESGEEESEEEESGDEEESEEEESGDEFEDEEGEGRVKKLVKKYDSGVKNTPKPAPSDDEEEEESGDEEEESDEEEDDDEEDEDESDGDEKAGDEEKGLFSDEHGDDAPKDADADAMQKRKRLHGIICCCCCLIIILAIVLGVVLGGKDKDDEDAKKPSPKPTPAPTTLPPTSAPTLHPVQIFFPVIADTFVRNGEFANETFGTDDTLLVRGGGNVSDAYIILEFDLTNLPPDTNIFQRESEVLLQLTHVESITDFTDSIVISRLPYDPAIDVDTLTWEDFSPEGALVGPSFTVQGDTETVTVDITGLIRETTQLRKGRRLQMGKILLMLGSADSENVYGEVFRSMEGGNETAPLIIHNFNTDSPTAAPSASKMPSLAPSMSAAPTLSSAPSVSRPPSSAPSLSAAPSTSTQPTAAPTKSAAPTGAPSPSPSANTNATSTSPSIGPNSNAVPSTVGPTPVVPQTSSSPVASTGTP